MRPLGANRLMRIGWSAVRMAPLMAKGGAPRNWRRSGFGDSLPVELFLKQHIAADGPVLGACSAARFTLAGRLGHVRIHLLLPGNILGGSSHVIGNLDQIKV